MVKLTTKKVLSETEFQLISIRDEVIKAVEESGIQNGFVLVMSAHTGGNAPGHLKQMLTGYEVMFPVIEGKALIRFAQDIYFAEFDGPQMRTYYIEVMGE